MAGVALEEQGTVGRQGGRWGWTGDHLVATSNLSLARLTLQALAPCFFLSVSQSSDVSKRGMDGFLEPELWPTREAGRRRERNQRRRLSSFVFSSLCFSVSTLSLPQSILTHQPCSGLFLCTVGLDCSELWLGQWPWSPMGKGQSILLAQTEAKEENGAHVFLHCLCHQ